MLILYNIATVYRTVRVLMMQTTSQQNALSTALEKWGDYHNL